MLHRVKDVMVGGDIGIYNFYKTVKVHVIHSYRNDGDPPVGIPRRTKGTRPVGGFEEQLNVCRVKYAG